ncbi:hypothetical protein JOC77_001654 [Peribacillus deserti]|uniref:Uncharacterized protein n=1 Tax=Peribacillus deserti TaxID=673318 RepID=A0ABS2QGE8_9BACI|nr:hypothetical protein [Peribacillus deserti]MBM7692227.1 hypothetical protein [Peribacillus deserti]
MNFRKGYLSIVVMLLILVIGCSKSPVDNVEEQFSPAQTDIVSHHDGIGNLTKA